MGVFSYGGYSPLRESVRGLLCFEESETWLADGGRYVYSVS